MWQADEQKPALSEKARLHLENYNFPVEMMVALPNGTIVNTAFPFVFLLDEILNIHVAVKHKHCFF